MHPLLRYIIWKLTLGSIWNCCTWWVVYIEVFLAQALKGKICVTSEAIVLQIITICYWLVPTGYQREEKMLTNSLNVSKLKKIKLTMTHQKQPHLLHMILQHHSLLQLRLLPYQPSELPYCWAIHQCKMCFINLQTMISINHLTLSYHRHIPHLKHCPFKTRYAPDLGQFPCQTVIKLKQNRLYQFHLTTIHKPQYRKLINTIWKQIFSRGKIFL